ncbi:MAG: zinc ABC transporter substrate-binding protein [Planctomycetes bacterium]|nr:zinc ABC transporter substrate-binding protein [Planctomycetota bacterium]
MALLCGCIITGTVQAGERKTVLCTTFPIYQITRNVTDKCENVEVQLMLPSQSGCPHDYAMTPQDMQKLAKTDILIINGLGLESFLGTRTDKLNPKMLTIDSSKGIKETLPYIEEHEDEGEHEEHDDEDKKEHHHHGSGTNPHLFASPRMAAKLAVNIAEQLSKADPDCAATYKSNAKKYSENMNKLADEMQALGEKLENNRIVQPHGVFDYLARDMGLERIAVMQSHGQEPSIAQMMGIIKAIQNKKVGAIFTEPQYSGKTGKTIAKETGVPLASLDPVATGPEDAPLDYYEKVMRENMKTLAKTLGAKTE